MKLLTATWVPGHPRTKGSLDVVNSGRRTGKLVLQDSDASRSWLLLTVGRVRDDLVKRYPYGYAPSTKPCYARMVFWIPAWRPLTEREITEDGIAAAAWDKAGDVDKLARNILDALSAPDADTETARRKRAGVYADDVQVQSTTIERFAASEHAPPGAAIEIYELSAGEINGARHRAAEWSRAIRGGKL